MSAGIRVCGVKTMSLQHVHVIEKQAHADQLAERNVQLGSKPDLSPERLW